MSSRILTHRAGLDDLDALLANVAAGFASYAEFAQEGWHPPDVHGRREWQGEILADPATWALLAWNEDLALPLAEYRLEFTRGKPGSAAAG